MKKLFTRAGQLLLNLLFPAECLTCRREGDWLCTDCFNKLKFNDDDKKYNLITPDINDIFIAGDYDDYLLADIIKKFKYNFLTTLGEPLGKFLISFWEQKLLTPNLKSLWDTPNSSRNILVVPIPLSTRRARWRGFNQAEILAREFSTHFSYTLNTNLYRSQHRPPQATLDEQERQNNIKNVFIWKNVAADEQNKIKGQAILLIDDVVTTGATINEAARVLRAAGAKKIYGLVLAKG